MVEPDQKPFTGTVGEVTKLFLSIALITLAGSIVLFIERLFYARLSAEIMEAAVNAIFVYSVFQIPCLVLVMMAQVCVGRLHGASEDHAIGSTIWQFIWFSLLSSLVVIPVGMFFGTYYFMDTSIETLALPYLCSLLCINFLYPLGTTLTSFYIGRGNTNLCLFASLVICGVNLLIAYPLIAGIEGWIPSFGLIGGTLGNFIAQGGFCLVLLAKFLSAKNAQTYGTRQWRFQPKLFWESVYPGLLRAANRVSVILCFACIAHLMITMQGDYLLCWSIGSTIALFLPFSAEAVCQALTTVASNIIGAKNYRYLGNVHSSGFLIILAIIAVVGIPLLLLPEATFHLLFPEIPLATASIQTLFTGVWLSFSFAALSYVPVSRILAFKDTKFFLLTGSLSWIKGYGLIYLAIYFFEVPGDQCFGVISLTNFIDLVLYQWRAHWLYKRLTAQQTTLTPQMATVGNSSVQ